MCALGTRWRRRPWHGVVLVAVVRAARGDGGLLARAAMQGTYTWTWTWTWTWGVNPSGGPVEARAWAGLGCK